MLSSLSADSVLDTFVPISRFDKGEAMYIFNEVQESGFKIVVRDSIPACVLLTPEKYRELVDKAEDADLYAIAETRLKNDTGVTISFDEILAKDGLTISDIEAMEDIEIE